VTAPRRPVLPPLEWTKEEPAVTFPESEPALPCIPDWDDDEAPTRPDVPRPACKLCDGSGTVEIGGSPFWSADCDCRRFRERFDVRD
jgi:hypothetical protein